MQQAKGTQGCVQSLLAISTNAEHKNQVSQQAALYLKRIVNECWQPAKKSWLNLQDKENFNTLNNAATNEPPLNEQDK